MSKYKVEIASNKEDLALLATQRIIEQLKSVLSIKDRVQIALSGGSTPARVYDLLSIENIDWSRIDVFLGDERWVDFSDKSSNTLMLRKTLLAKSPGSKAIFHSVPTTELASPEASAEAFDKLLTEKCIGSPPSFDLMLLGLGDDGHTASLFPGSHSLSVVEKWATTSTGKGHDRITLTAPVLSASSKVIFLVSGKAKQIALRRLLDPKETSTRTPAKLVQPDHQILVLTDQAASELLSN